MGSERDLVPRMDGLIVLTQGGGDKALRGTRNDLIRPSGPSHCSSQGHLASHFTFALTWACAINIHAAPDGGQGLLLSSPSHAAGPWMDLAFQAVPRFTHL